MNDDSMSEVDWLRSEIAWLYKRLDEPEIKEVLCIYQMGHETLLSLNKDGFTEGILDGALVITGMRAMLNKAEIRAAPGQDGYIVRSLQHLVASAADSFEFVRDGDSITNVTTDSDGTPWRRDVGEVIVRHFAPVLRLYMPQGRWHLGIGAAS